MRMAKGKRVKTTVKKCMRRMQEAAEDVKALSWEAYLATAGVPSVRDVLARLDMRARWLTRVAEDAIRQLRAYDGPETQLEFAY